MSLNGDGLMAIWAAAIGAAGGLGASVMGRDASNAASDKALAAQLMAFKYANKELAPYNAVGDQGLYDYASLLGIEGYRTPEEIEYNKLLNQYNKMYGEGVKQTDVGRTVNRLLNDKFETPYEAKYKASHKQKKDEWDAKLAAALEAKNKSLEGFDPTAKLRSTPGYQFRYNTGLNALQNSQAARGYDQSGRAMKELVDYGQNFATNEYQNELARRASVMDLGRNTTTSLANIGLGMGNNASNTFMQQGQNNANMYYNMNNALQGSLANYAYLRNNPQRTTPNSAYSINSATIPNESSTFGSQWITG